MAEKLTLCPVCVKEGKKSQVFPGVAMTTAMYAQAFYDEKGKYHCHDPNITTRTYTCTNRHQWRVRSHGNCPCGWNGGKPEVEILK